MTTAEAFGRGTIKVGEAVRRYSIGRTKLYELMNSGEIPYTRLGATRLIPVAVLEDRLRRGAVGLETEPAGRK